MPAELEKIMQKIFIIEDDSIIASSVEKYLNGFGYETRHVRKFDNIVNEFAEYNPHLVLMDISLPYYNGFYWCSEIRKISKVPIIFVSSSSDNMNIVMAINMGGDDFIAKPFELSLLLAKIQAMLRRTYDFASQTNLIEHNGLILDMGNATATYKESAIELTRNEFKILKILMDNRGKTVSREDIMTVLWESDSYVDDNTLTVNVTRLRKKLENAGLEGLIETKKGMGYYIANGA